MTGTQFLKKLNIENDHNPSYPTSRYQHKSSEGVSPQKATWMIPRGQKTDAAAVHQGRMNEADVSDAHGEAWLNITKNKVQQATAGMSLKTSLPSESKQTQKVT